MFGISYMRRYSAQVLKQKLGTGMEFLKHKKRDGSKTEIRKEAIGDIELSIFKLVEKPLYELRLSFEEFSRSEKRSEAYTIKDITEKEMLSMCNSFRKLYDEIKK